MKYAYNINLFLIKVYYSALLLNMEYSYFLKAQPFIREHFKKQEEISKEKKSNTEKLIKN